MATTRAPAEVRVGVLTKRGRFIVAEPFFERGRRINVELRRRGDVRVGELVLLRPSRRGGGSYEVVRSLGRPHIARNVIEALLFERGYERGVSSRVETEALEVSRAGDPAARREDLTAMPAFTIDPASARDFDDAVSAEPRGDGLRLLVHIADVASFVAPGSALDTEAAERGNSVYVPGTVEPMLPEALSSNVCSLVPGQERRAFTVDMELDARAEAGRVSFYRSMIRSDARMTYEQVDRIFAGEERAPEAVAEPLALARRAAQALRDRRLARGALGLDTSEPEFDFDELGNVVGAKDVEQEESHRVIEQLMILANEQVALRLENGRIPTVCRVHEQPDPERVKQLVAQLASLDVPTPPFPKDITPRTAGELVGRISVMVLKYLEGGRPGRLALTSLVLRSLKQAVYSPRNIGHAGLASAAYCHFTSPIRRYPDLVVHRSLLSTLGEGEAPPAHGLEETATHCTETERQAMGLERDADSICLAFLLERELSAHGWEETFEGEVTGVIPAGVFVSFLWEGVGAACEGFLPVRRIGGDYYDLNEERTALVGRRTGRMLRLGDPIAVRVHSIEAPRGRVDLERAGRAP